MSSDSACMTALVGTMFHGKAFDAVACSTILNCTLEDAYAAQDRALALMPDRIGYKVALASSEAQQSYMLCEPVYGQLFRSQLLADGAIIQLADAGENVIAHEPDLLVAVGSEAINDAETVEQVAQSLTQVYAFLEVPQLLLLPQGKGRAAVFIATNAGARYGVIGTSAEIGPEAIGNLAEMTVSVRNGDGDMISMGRGSDLMGHPLNPALFLLRKLRGQGRRVRKGDVISLGSFGPPIPAEPGRIEVSYTGLADRPLTVSAEFK